MTTVADAEAVDLAELARSHRLAVWRYLRYLGCDDTAADDLAQETFLAVTRRPPEGVAARAWPSYLRTDGAEPVPGLDPQGTARAGVADLDLADEVWREFAGDDGGNARIEALRGCVEQLTGRAREAIDLHYREAASRLTIAERLEMTADGVKTLLRRTRDVLRQCVERKLKRE